VDLFFLQIAQTSRHTSAMSKHADEHSVSRRNFLTRSLTGAGLLATLPALAQPSAPIITNNVINVRDFGATGDGKSDDTAKIQAALDRAANSTPVCLLPPGKYRINASLTVPAGVTLCGISGGVPHSEHPIGSLLLSYGGRGNANGTPLITLKPNAVLRNVIIHYPEQQLANVAPYPWTVRIDGELCQVTDVTMTNPFQAIDTGSNWNELHLIRNIFACPLSVGIYIDQCSDIGRIENVHFNPNFWQRMDLDPQKSGHGDIRGYLENNLTGFKIGRTDWEFISNCFVIFAKIGFHFDDFGHGPGNAVITQSGSDICPVAVRIDRTQAHAGVQWANGQFMSTVEIAPTNHGPVKFANCGFWGMERTQEHIRHNGPSTLSLTSCHFTAWDRANKKDPAVRASNGRLIVNACEFMDGGKPAIRLDKGVKAAAIFGNTFRTPSAIQNDSSAELKLDLNTHS
jgi:hypothetical protein